jgi:TPR repeat protein
MEGTSSVLGIVLCNDNPLQHSIDQTISEALMKEDYVTVHRRARLLAESGDANAQVLLGALFQEGWGTAKDLGEAVQWYRNASEQGHPVAQCLLANRYRDGEGGLCKDLEQTRALYLKAAKQNYATAFMLLLQWFTGGRLDQIWSKHTNGQNLLLPISRLPATSLSWCRRLSFSRKA